MSSKAIEQDMRKFVKGASFITVQDLCKYLGRSRNTTLKIIRSVPTVDGRLYFIPDVAEVLSINSKEAVKND